MYWVKEEVYLSYGGLVCVSYMTGSVDWCEICWRMSWAASYNFCISFLGPPSLFLVLVRDVSGGSWEMFRSLRDTKIAGINPEETPNASGSGHHFFFSFSSGPSTLSAKRCSKSWTRAMQVVIIFIYLRGFYKGIRYLGDSVGPAEPQSNRSQPHHDTG